MIDSKNKRDPKCIWMTAGIISYKLCDRNFECDNCDFDQSMKGIVPQTTGAEPNQTKVNSVNEITDAKNSHAIQFLVDEYLTNLLKNYQIHLDRYYHQDYFWFATEDPNTAQVGLDKLVCRLFDPIENIIFPKIGESFSKGQLVGWIVRKKTTLPLHSPINGKVISINSAVAADGLTTVIKNDLFLFKMQDQKLIVQLRESCGKNSGIQTFTNKMEFIKATLAQSFCDQYPEKIGTTHADGGTIQLQLEKVIGKEKFRSLITYFFEGNVISKKD